VIPVITEDPIDIPAMMGDNVTFNCTATGIPLPTITWMNESITLMDSDVIIDSTTILSTFTLSNLQDDDFDNYTCTATNVFGSDNVTLLLGSELLYLCTYNDCWIQFSLYTHM